jgi:hypothetical protein
MMVSSIILITLAAAAPVAVDSPHLLSPAKAIGSLEAWLHPSTIKLRVGDVTRRGDNWVLVADAELEGRDRFEVELSSAVIAEFARIGVADPAAHFVGREVEVRGQVSRSAVWIEPVYFIGALRVDSLDQIRAVR